MYNRLWQLFLFVAELLPFKIPGYRGYDWENGYFVCGRFSRPGIEILFKIVVQKDGVQSVVGVVNSKAPTGFEALFTLRMTGISGRNVHPMVVWNACTVSRSVGNKRPVVHKVNALSRCVGISGAEYKNTTKFPFWAQLVVGDERKVVSSVVDNRKWFPVVDFTKNPVGLRQSVAQPAV